ncbi:MAG: M20/M25/M40 family metallo-hydrolase [Woeseiaceae bacterium]
MIIAKLRTHYVFAILAVGLASCSNDQTTETTSQSEVSTISGDAIFAHVALLADDLYEGREAGTRGYQLAAKYVATQFATMGLTPGNDGSYFQTVSFATANIVNGSRELTVSGAEGERRYAALKEFTSTATLAGEEVSVTAPLVFVGYGVNAPSIERNDYEGIDLEGKIAVVVIGAPTALGSEVRAFYRSSRYHKSIQLEQRGAVGVIELQHKQISSDGAAVRGSQSPKYWSIDDHNHPKYAFKGLQVDVRMLESGARELFDKSPISFEEMASGIENETYESMDLGLTATISQRVINNSVSGDNVVAVLEGSDPVLKHEYVVMTAHLDGKGMGHESGDNVYNGFYDNASGVGTMLEVAKALASAAERPKRSIIFVATVGEEKGLLGADYYANNPTVPVESIVANVNMDMVMFLWQAQDVVAFGANHSTLQDIVKRATDKVGMKLSPDPFPERGYFTRSDQFPFVQQGIPAVFFATGFETQEAGIDPEALYNEFMQTHYHGATDDQNLRFDRPSASIVATANYMIASEIANTEQRPRWLKDDFFGDLYGTELTRPE